MSPTREPHEPDLDEDLFDFDGVAREPEPSADEDLDRVFASLRESLAEEDLLGDALASPPAPALPRQVAPVRPRAPLADAAHAAPGPAEPLYAPPEAPGAPLDETPAHAALAPDAPPFEWAAGESSDPGAAEGAYADEAAPEGDELFPAPPLVTPAGARTSASTRVIVGVAIAVTLINSVVAVAFLRGRGEAAHAVEAARAEPAPAPAPETARPAPAVLPDPDSVGAVGAAAKASAHPALDAARAEIARGEYAGARQRVYGLLAIIDRLEEPRRSALEADCQFLVAQTLHLEALARMGGAP